MAIRVGINGFGRIGRTIVRAAWGLDPRLQGQALEEPAGLWGNGNFEIVHINEYKGGIESASHLLKFDSLHGMWPVRIKTERGGLRIGSRKVSFSEKRDPKEVNWDSIGVDIVLECSGKFRTIKTLAKYFDCNIKKVIVAAPVNEPEALNVVVGINDGLYDVHRHKVITAASCTTNCLAPVVKVIHENIGILHGSVTTIHDATNTQVVLDAPQNDLRRARSSLLNLIPTSTGSATAIGLIFKELKGKLDGMAVRVPVLNASLIDCVFEVSRATTSEEVNGLIKDAAEGMLSKILGYEELPLVSTDYCNDTRSAIVDGLSTMVVDNTQLKILAWYDNEVGYACRMSELLEKVAVSIKD